MANNLTEQPSSSLSFTSSSSISNGSSIDTTPTSTAAAAAAAACGRSESGSSMEMVCLSKLSCNLERLLLDSEFDSSDAEITVEGLSVGVHRCILAARSKFFYDLFITRKTRAGSGIVGKAKGKPQYCMGELVPYGRVGYEAFTIILAYLYTGKLKPSPQEVSICVDAVCAHDACRPTINFVVEMMYASYAFQIPELVSLFQRRLLNFVEKALVEDVIPIVLVAFHSQLTQLRNHCIQRVVRSVLDNISLEKELPHEVVGEIKSIRLKTLPKEPHAPTVDPVHEKRIKRIHRALDSDDTELVKLLLTESSITLDDAKALHYAASYCDPNVVAEVLELGSANVNLKNSRGYTPLHVAAMRSEPAVLVSLLTKGASASELTAAGQSAVRICRRLTRAKDYYARTTQGEVSNKNRLCIDILEREMRRNHIAREDSVSSPMMADDLHMKLLYLENRVVFARLLFPAEAKVAMEIAQADTTSEFAGLSGSKNSSSNLREVDLNETPTMQNKRLRSRMDALMRTVELGRRYFPKCSQVLDKFMEDYLLDHFYLQRGTPDEQKIKRLRFCELKEDVRKAFSKDKADNGLPELSSSSSSSLEREMKQQKVSWK